MLSELFIESWKVLCQLAPWMIMGTVLAGLLHVFLPANFLRRNLQGSSGVLKAVGLGVPLPLCSCGVIPTGIGLKNDGAGNGAAVGFLISTPQTGVDSVLIAASFLGWPFAIFKLVSAAVMGIIGGLIAERVPDRENKASARRQNEHQSKKWQDFFLQADEILHSIWLWLMVGVVVSAAISVWVPDSFLQNIGQWGLLPAILLVLLFSVPLYVCATASVPIAAALVAGGLPTAVALVFLVAGPATNIATITSVYGRFGFKITSVYLATIIFGSALAAWMFDGLLSVDSVSQSLHHHDVFSWWEHASAGLLVMLFGWYAYKDICRRVAKYRVAPVDDQAPSNRIPVSGMNCQSCVSRIEKAVNEIDGLESLSVSLENNDVSYSGSVDRARVEQVISELGFYPETENKPLA